MSASQGDHHDLWSRFKRLMAKPEADRDARAFIGKVVELEKRLETGDYPDPGVAYFCLGIMYEADGSPVHSLPMAWQRYERSLAAGIGNAACQLADLCAGVEVRRPNDRVAVDWLRKGSDLGSIEASIRLGAALFQGSGIRKNRVEALRRLHSAAKAGSVDAAAEIACFEIATVTELAADKGALQRIKQLARRGSPVAQAYEGMAGLFGDARSRGAERALALLRTAAKAGHSGAAFALYQAYTTGTRIERNRRLSKRWLDLAYVLRHPDAQVSFCRERILMWPEGAQAEVTLDGPVKTWQEFRFIAYTVR